MIVNSLGRELPEKIGDYVVRPYQGAYVTPAPTHYKISVWKRPK